MLDAAALAFPLLLGLAAPAVAQELPPDIRVDRFMVQADRQIANGQYAAALRTLDRVLELHEEHDVALPDSYWMKRAEGGLGAEDYLEAIASATRYLELAGREGEQYGKALGLLDRAVAEGCMPAGMTETLESVRACLAAGADPNGVGEDGRTALDWAAARENPAITAALIAAGADPAVAVDMARESGQVEPGTVFSDCARCPEMVVVPAGSFMMGSPASEEGRRENEGPRHRVTIGTPFAVGVYEVTFAEWDACVAAGGCGGYRPPDEGWGRGSRPVINVSWRDAQRYVAWLSEQTGEPYRLLSEAEWEFVARAGSTAARYWGERGSQQCRHANGFDQDLARTDQGRVWMEEFDWANPVPCSDGYAWTAPVGSYRPSPFGLYDILGNVIEWTEDCWNPGYSGAPVDGRAWESGECLRRVVRGGSWVGDPGYIRSARRHSLGVGYSDDSAGFRVARSVN